MFCICVLTYVPGNYPAKVLLKDVKFWKQSHGCRVKKIVFLSCRISGQSYMIFCLFLSFVLYYTITYKSSLTQKKLYKKTNAIFSIYGKNGIIPWHFFNFCSVHIDQFGEVWDPDKSMEKKCEIRSAKLGWGYDKCLSKFVCYVTL